MNDSEFDQLLGSAKITVTPQAGFQRDVWLRIEAAEANTWKPRLALLAERFFKWLAFPQVALATCSVMLAVGVLTGLASGKPSSQGETKYIQSISPFAHSQHR